MKYVIDRFEGNYAVLENLETKEIKDEIRTNLPQETKEGDVLNYECGKYIFDPYETDKRQRDVLKRFQKLKNNDSL